jgi:glycosyltransferase involved in cell wall biosynthesis
MTKLSLCMITKNEEHFLEQCLNSVKDLVDEIIIVDTGSTDKTKEIAKNFTDKIFDFEWCDDFSAARNESLKHATCDWILVLDADELIAREDHQKIKEIIKKNNTGGFILIQRNYFKSKEDLNYGSFENLRVSGAGQDNQGFVNSNQDNYVESNNFIGWIPTPIIRLFRNNENILFTGVVHEDVSSSIKKNIVPTVIPIHHYGKINTDTWMKKWDLYEKLGEKKVEEEKDYYAYFELGRQYLENKKIDLAKKMFNKSSQLNPNFWLNWFNLGTIYLIEKKTILAKDCLEKAKMLNNNVSSIYSNLGVIYAQEGNFSEAIENFLKAININPNDASAYKNLGMCYDSIGNKEKAYLSFKKAIELNPEYKKTIQLGSE